MGEQRQVFDVWVIENNTVYRDVPFSVMTDWVQQGRLLDDDKVRPAGTAQWVRLVEMPLLAPYVPKAEPFRAEDKAEALEPVQIDFSWKRRRDWADEDVDMIPLIDVSLVLLVFFMMTAAVGGAGSIFNTPKAEHMLLDSDARMWWVGIARDQDGKPVYSLGKGEAEGKQFENRAALVRGIESDLQKEDGAVKIRIRADERLPIEVIREMTADLEGFKMRGKVIAIFGEVSEKTP
jgi:biopolymer transport protein ExbD